MTADVGDEDAQVDELRDRVVAIVGDWDGAEQVTMFGLPSFTAHGELFCVVSAQGLSMTQLPNDDRAELSAVVDVTSFDADGRTVDRWATVATEALPDDETLIPFLKASYDAALTDA